MSISVMPSPSTCSEPFSGPSGPGLPPRVGGQLERVSSSVVRRLEKLPWESCLRIWGRGPPQQARWRRGCGHRWLLKPM